MDCLMDYQGYYCRKFAATNINSVPKQSKSSRLVSQVHMNDGWAKCKEKVPDVLDPNQNVQTTCNSKPQVYIT